MGNINVYKKMIDNCRKFPGSMRYHTFEHDDNMISYSLDIYPNFTDEKYLSWPSYSYMMYDLFKCIRDTSSRAVMEQAFYLEYINRINKSSVKTKTSIKKQKTDAIAIYYDNLSYNQRETIETKMLEYETAIAVVLNIYKTFMKTQNLICKYLADNGEFKIDTDETYKWMNDMLNAIEINNQNDNNNCETVLSKLKTILENQFNDNWSINELYSIQWKLICISHCLYYNDSSDETALMKKYIRWSEQLYEPYFISETIELINSKQIAPDDERVGLVEYELFYIPLELISYRLYSYVNSFHDELKK